MIPARRIIEIVASRVAITHAMLWVKPTLTPSSDARSALSELARSAMPMLVKRRNANSPMIESSVAITAMRSLAWKMIGLISKLKSKGGLYVCCGKIGAQEERDGDAEPGEQLREADGDDHQDQARCLGEPADDHELDERAERHRRDQRERERDPERPHLERTSDTQRLAGTAPRSACAKLMTLLDR